mgnify:CR=1 FL=1
MQAEEIKKRINMMLANGEVTYLDPESGYRYTVYANCPDDGSSASVARITKENRTGSSVTNIIFKCPICGNLFNGKADNMSLR